MTKESKLLLDPVAIVLGGINENLENMSYEELQALRKACDEPDTGNCWVWTYRAAQYLKPILDDHIEHRCCVKMQEGS